MLNVYEHLKLYYVMIAHSMYYMHLNEWKQILFIYQILGIYLALWQILQCKMNITKIESLITTISATSTMQKSKTTEEHYRDNNLIIRFLNRLWCTSVHVLFTF